MIIIPRSKSWSEHLPQPVTEGENVAILWDNGTHKDDKKINNNRPDIISKDTIILIDTTVPTNRNLTAKDLEGLSKCKDFEIDLSRLKAKIIPVVGAM